MKDANANTEKMKHAFLMTCSLNLMVLCCRSAVSMIGGNYSVLDLIPLVYADMILIHYCHHAFQKLPRRQKWRRWLLRFALFLMVSGVFVAIVSQSAPFYGPLAAALLYAMAIGGTAFAFYAYIIYDGHADPEDCQDLRFDYLSEKL